MHLKKLKAKSILHYHKQTFATNWDANVYRGCAHNCQYCFAQYSHKYLNTAGFFKDIFVKQNAPELLDKELRKKNWQKFPVNVCGISDCYQPKEKDYRIIPKVIKSFIANKNPLVIITKSILILRDLELIKELNKVAEVSIVISVSTLDETKRKLVEPNSAPTIKRMKMLKKFREIGCKTSVLFMPVLPYISDGEKNMNEIFKITKKYELGSIDAMALHLRGTTKKVFYSFLNKNFTDLLPKYQKLYIKDTVSNEYKLNLQRKIKALRTKYQPYSKYKPSPPVIRNQSQLQLF